MLFVYGNSACATDHSETIRWGVKWLLFVFARFGGLFRLSLCHSPSFNHKFHLIWFQVERFIFAKFDCRRCRIALFHLPFIKRRSITTTDKLTKKIGRNTQRKRWKLRKKICYSLIQCNQINGKICLVNKSKITSIKWEKCENNVTFWRSEND